MFFCVGGVTITFYLFWATFILSLDSYCAQRYEIGNDSDLVCNVVVKYPMFWLLISHGHHVGLLKG